MTVEPQELAGTTYDVLEVEGAPVLAGTAPDLAFGLDGRVSGRATVNRLMGGYALEGGVLTFGMLATTMMAGPPEQMEQEQRVLRALGLPLRVEAGDADGDVRLVSDAGVTLLRARTVPDAGPGPESHRGAAEA